MSQRALISVSAIGQIFASHLLADPEVEAGYIASPVQHHARQIMLCAEAGKHILCEKPLTRDLREARKAVGHTSPNPAVGAVLFSRNCIVSRGYHRGPGLPHAEIDCLRKFKRDVPKDAVLYVTLEPCSSVGRTGACTDALIHAGVKSVVIGTMDPNPQHRGRAAEILRNAGIEVRFGILAEGCAVLNEAFNKWIATGIPFVIAKCGMSLDGRLTRPKKESRWLTSGAARRHAQQLRAQMDAILVGANTVRIDNPRLTVRDIRGVRQPLRVVLTRSGKLPPQARILTDRGAKRSFFHRSLRQEQFCLSENATRRGPSRVGPEESNQCHDRRWRKPSRSRFGRAIDR